MILQPKNGLWSIVWKIFKICNEKLYILYFQYDGEVLLCSNIFGKHWNVKEVDEEDKEEVNLEINGKQNKAKEINGKQCLWIKSLQEPSVS